MAHAERQSWYLYLVRCSDGSLYTGITKDVIKRVAAHTAKRGGKYTRSRAPVMLVLKHRFKNHRRAAQAEVRIKQLKKAERERLVTTGTIKGIWMPGQPRIRVRGMARHDTK